ncbi:MAG: hypothetical protein IGQ45_10875 [Cyanobacterium sp. T60_A2020_053]|nr:hypothetical protein [Cyanobacterium sp. T60_A2020_053]
MENQQYEQESIHNKLKPLTEEILALAENSQDNCLELIHILREIEFLHRNIVNDFLSASLPETRHHLYILLRHIEEEGGWPYIPRFRIKNLCEKLLMEEETTKL